MRCLLCDSADIKVTEKYAKIHLANLWRSLYPHIDQELTLDDLYVYKCNVCSLKFFDPKLAGGDKFYSTLGNLDWYYLHPGKTEYDYVQKYIKDGYKILDIGAGRGVLYSKIKANVDYTGLELSTKAVALAKEGNINVIQEDLQSHAQGHEDNYDIVCLFQVLEHLTELDSFLNSLKLTLKSKGLFVIAVPNNDGFISHSPNYTFNLPPHHTILWTASSLRYLANKYDFDIVSVDPELLQDVHRDYAHKSFIASRIRRFFFLPNLLIDYSRSNQLISDFSERLYGNFIFRKLILPFVRKKQRYGQSIIVTLQKK